MILPLLANTAWALLERGRWDRFRGALADPGRAQREVLHRYLRANADTVFGRRHRLATIDRVEAFRRRVPLSTWDDYVEPVDRIRRGEPGVLTREPVLRLVPSSGSTAARKLVPFTDTFGREVRRAVGPWIVDLFRRRPRLKRGRAYWSISPAIRCKDDGAVALGFDDDSAYLGGLRRLVDRTLAVPSDVRHLEDLDDFRFATLRHLLAAEDLTLISVWHPSFLTLLLGVLERDWDRLLETLDRRRAGELRRVGPQPRAIWPRLEVISCWADGHARAAATSLARLFPGVAIEPKGLIATEAFVSVPFAGRRPVAVRSHFFELLDDGGQAHLVDELRDGGEYSVVATTGSGLWRYRLRDRVAVDGFLGATPCLRFLGRDDRVSDRVGEKLSDAFAARVLAEVLGPLDVVFAMLAPDEGERPGDDRPGTTLYLESRGRPPADLAARLDRALGENPYYRHAVDLGQLAPARVVLVEGAQHTFLEHHRRSGKRLGDVKPAALSTETGWSRRFRRRV